VAAAARDSEREGASGGGERGGSSVGLYKLNPVDPHSLKGAWFQPLTLSSDLLVSNFAFKWVNLYRYSSVNPFAPKLDDHDDDGDGSKPVHAVSGVWSPVGLHKLNPVYPKLECALLCGPSCVSFSRFSQLHCPNAFFYFGVDDSFGGLLRHRIV
jgi:hypothetical protein